MEREDGLGAIPSESIVDDHGRSPEEACEIAGEVSAALVAVLERLGPDERTAFLLREVFDYDYPEVAAMVGKSEAACRQLIHRARTHLRECRARFAVTPQCRERILGKFLVAMATGDRQAVLAFLAEQIDCVRVASPAIA
jgi:RNA polymerase sigma-70 factor (ECF subfamily)